MNKQDQTKLNHMHTKSMTCMIYKDNNLVYQSDFFGVKPLMEFYKKYHTSYTDLVIVDKIIGKAAIILASIIGAKKVITPIASTHAIEFASNIGLDLIYNKEVPYIINRTKDGICPIEESVLDTDSLDEGLKNIISTINILMKK